MKKWLWTILIMLLFIPLSVSAKTKDITLQLFYNESCPHCEALMEWLNTDYLKNNKLTKK